MKMKIAILTGGGDCPGLNGAIKWVTKSALDSRIAAVVDSKISSEGIFWVTTVLPKQELSELTGVQYVVESKPETGIELKPEPKKETP